MPHAHFHLKLVHATQAAFDALSQLASQSHLTLQLHWLADLEAELPLVWDTVDSNTLYLVPLQSGLQPGSIQGWAERIATTGRSPQTALPLILLLDQPLAALPGPATWVEEIRSWLGGVEIWALDGLTVEELERSLLTRLEQVRLQPSPLLPPEQQQEGLCDYEERYALVAQGANDGLWDWNLKTGVVYFSPRWKAMLGYTDALRPMPEEWLNRIHPDDLESVRASLHSHLEGRTPHFEQEYRMLHASGAYRWMLGRGLAQRNADGQATRIAGSQTDISGRRQVEEQLLYEAFHDALTGLPNRALLMERLRQSLTTARHHPDQPFAVLFLDVDRFKVINDSLGHLMGDCLLVAIAKRLSTCLRPHDTIARLGGDEFVLLLENIGDLKNATGVADRIQREFQEPFHLVDYEVFTGVSIGIAMSHPDYEWCEDLLRDADTAMYRAKALGKARYEVFHPGMHQRAVALLTLENDLRRAVDRQEFRLHYQPIISLRDLRIMGFEALIRWQHPEKGMISPAEFIPVTEETGLIRTIGRWALHEACRQMREWTDYFPNFPPLVVSVNLSGKQFTPHLIDQVREMLAQTRLGAHQLKLELTESILMENAEQAIAILTQLKHLGVQLSIDDFGTGYSSLSYLHRFPIDTLKVDRSFINKLDSDGEQLAIVRTIMTLAWNLGIDVIAEGVETLKQLAQLKSLQCDAAQGYFFARPLDPQSIRQLLNSNVLPWHEQQSVLSLPPSMNRNVL